MQEQENSELNNPNTENTVENPLLDSISNLNSQNTKVNLSHNQYEKV